MVWLSVAGLLAMLLARRMWPECMCGFDLPGTLHATQNDLAGQTWGHGQLSGSVPHESLKAAGRVCSPRSR